MRKTAICAGVLLALLLDFAIYSKAVKPLLANPLLAACRELKPGMTETEAIAIVEAHHDEGFFRYAGTGESIGAKRFLWVNFLFDNPEDEYRVPDWLPVYIEYIDAKGLEVGICESVICEVDMSTRYHYSRSMMMRIRIPGFSTDLVLYPENTGIYELEDDCGPTNQSPR